MSRRSPNSAAESTGTVSAAATQPSLRQPPASDAAAGEPHLRMTVGDMQVRFDEAVEAALQKTEEAARAVEAADAAIRDVEIVGEAFRAELKAQAAAAEAAAKTAAAATPTPTQQTTQTTGTPQGGTPTQQSTTPVSTQEPKT
jgi:hypothetical protein